MYCVADSKYADKLTKLGFSERLCANPESCKNWYEHCTKYDMRFLKDSYGTIVHKDFNKFFKTINRSNKRNQMKEEIIEDLGIRNHGVIDHTNLLQSKIYKHLYLLTTSPYYTLNHLQEYFKEYTGEVYVFNNNFLDYYVFINNNNGYMRNPLSELNYAFINAPTNSESYIKEINTQIYEKTGMVDALMKL